MVHLVVPKLTHPPQDFVFYSQRMAFVECGVDNKTFPEPTVEWFKNSAPVNFNDRIFFSPNTKSLLIRDSRQSDSGMYTCKVSNVAGKIEHNASITITSGVANGMYLYLYYINTIFDALIICYISVYVHRRI